MTTERNAAGSPPNRAIDALLAVLPRGAKVRLPRDRTGNLVLAGQPVSMTWVGNGSLGEVRDRLDSLSARPDVVAARELSPGARELLAKAGIGWVDETGAAEIAVGSVIVSRTGRPSARPAKPKGWTPGVIAVAEALLCGTKATVAAMEEATGLSAGTCTNALRFLTEFGLLEASAGRGRGSARRVADRRRLLDAYQVAVGAQPPSISVEVGVAWSDTAAGLEGAGRRWDKADRDWAATGAVAASVLAPYLTTVTTADVYIDARTIAELEAVAADVGFRPIEGGRLTLRPFPTTAVRRLAAAADGLRVAPWPRVYADLLATGVRGEEAAEHLLGVIDAR